MPTTYQKPCDTHRQLSTRLLICIDKSQLNANHVHDRQYTCQALGWILTQYVDQVDFEQSREKPSGQLKCIASRADEKIKKRQMQNWMLNAQLEAVTLIILFGFLENVFEKGFSKSNDLGDKHYAQHAAHKAKDVVVDDEVHWLADWLADCLIISRRIKFPPPPLV